MLLSHSNLKTIMGLICHCVHPIAPSGIRRLNLAPSAPSKIPFGTKLLVPAKNVQSGKLGMKRWKNARNRRKSNALQGQCWILILGNAIRAVETASDIVHLIVLSIMLCWWHVHNARKISLTMMLLQTNVRVCRSQNHSPSLAQMDSLMTKPLRSASKHQLAIGQWLNALLLLLCGMKVWEDV